MVTRYLKIWLHLPQSATHVILYYPGICCLMLQERPRLASCNASSDCKLKEMGIHLHLGKIFLQSQEYDYSILLTARKQLSSLPTARSLYVRPNNQLLSESQVHL